MPDLARVSGGAAGGGYGLGGWGWHELQLAGVQEWCKHGLQQDALVLVALLLLLLLPNPLVSPRLLIQVHHALHVCAALH